MSDTILKLNSGELLWGDFFGNEGGSDNETFENTIPVSDYEYTSIDGYRDNINVKYEGNEFVGITSRVPSGVNQVQDGHLYFSKDGNGVFQTSDINLYGATKVSLSYSQGTSSSKTIAYIISNGVEVEIGSRTDKIDKVTFEYDIPEGVKTIRVKIEHPSSNNKNTRVDNIELKYLEGNDYVISDEDDKKPNMDINYISTNVLNTYNKSKYYGYFVYLRNDYNGYPKGLYFGGDEGWEYLTNQNMSFVPTSHIQTPLDNETVYTFNFELQEYFPTNWNNIEKFVNIYNNVQKDAGTYRVDVALRFEDWSWDDEKHSNETKQLTFKINPLHVDEGDVFIGLNKTTWKYGEPAPHVDYITYNNSQQSSLVFGRDYLTSTDETTRKITITFINNFEGTVVKTYGVEKIEIPKPVFSQIVYMYSGEEFSVYPDNWDEIKNYCEISGNTHSSPGKYTIYFKLKDPFLYCWEGGSKSILEYEYRIAELFISTPVWNETEIQYDWTEHNFYPSNWNDIKEFCTIENNTNHKNVGDYEVIIRLNKVGYTWTDRTKEVKSITCKITKFIVEYPIWSEGNYFYFSGSERIYQPNNWDRIKDYCNMSGERNTFVSGENGYETVITLKDKNNYGWVTPLTDYVTSKDVSHKWYILQSDGWFITAYIEGSPYVNSTLTCIVRYNESVSEYTYNWYRSKTVNLSDASYIQSSNDNTYVVQPNDVNHFIICVVEVKTNELSGYKGGKTTCVSITKVQKVLKYNVLSFENDIYEASIPPTISRYDLPNVIGIEEDDDCVLEYSVIQGNDVVELMDINEGVLLPNGIGDAIIEVRVKDSSYYEYVPDTLRFTLHIYSNDTILWGLYDKTEDETVEDIILKGQVPQNAVVPTLKENEKGFHSLLKRKCFPYRKETGEEQVYFGWYVLIPTTKRVEEMDENGGSPMNIKELQLMKDENPLVVRSEEGREYYAYGKFNVGKMSDRWMLHVLFK